MFHERVHHAEEVKESIIEYKLLVLSNYEKTVLLNEKTVISHLFFSDSRRTWLLTFENSMCAHTQGADIHEDSNN